MIGFFVFLRGWGNVTRGFPSTDGGARGALAIVQEFDRYFLYVRIVTGEIRRIIVYGFSHEDKKSNESGDFYEKTVHGTISFVCSGSSLCR